MKERIVVDEQNMVKSMKVALYEEDKLFCLQKVEKIPETWEELLDLCKKLNNKKVEIIFVDIGIIIHLDDNCEISFTDTFKDMWFKKKDFETRIKTDLTPQQMWGIIKNLIGED